MKAVIFAGGVGTRMWPLSRVNTPKQFEKLIDKKSTLQLTVARIKPQFDWQDIYISTGKRYLPIIKKQVPQIPPQNLIAEPEMRDVAPAVGYVSAIIAKTEPDTPMAILWSDHIMKKEALFRRVLQAGANYIRQHPDRFLFIGQKPRFANQNLGWIEVGKTVDHINGFAVHRFVSWKYRPNIQLARQFFHSGHHVWNPGYWIVTPRFVLQQYQRFMPTMYRKLLKLQASYGQPGHQKLLAKIYPTFEKISFDDAILEKLEPEKAVVLVADFGWSDVGTWQFLKEALQKKPGDNVTKGKTVLYQCKNSLVYNYTDQLVTTIDLENMIVVVTPDVIMICTDESMKNIKKVVNQFKASRTYKRYT